MFCCLFAARCGIGWFVMQGDQPVSIVVFWSLMHAILLSSSQRATLSCWFGSSEQGCMHEDTDVRINSLS